MRIAVDAMGGDYAPQAIVAGAVAAARAYPGIAKIYLVGREEPVRAALAAEGECPAAIEVVPATEVVEMHDAPAAAIRRKRDSSILRAVNLVKDGQADAFFSAGNTGAAVAATTLRLRTLPGVDRPAIAAIMPTPVKPFVLVDAGANPDSPARLLYQFAVMGMVYSREILGVPQPTVGLLSIGSEEAKGNEITREAYRLLEESPLVFKGNVESRDLFEGRVDVVVCDGFVGNVVLKTSESVASAIGHWLKVELTRNPVRLCGAWLCRNGLRRLKALSDPAVYGGAPLLGVRGLCIIGHGSSRPLAVQNALRVALESERHNLNDHISELLTAPEIP